MFIISIFVYYIVLISYNINLYHDMVNKVDINLVILPTCNGVVLVSHIKVDYRDIIENIESRLVWKKFIECIKSNIKSK